MVFCSSLLTNYLNLVSFLYAVLTTKEREMPKLSDKLFDYTPEEVSDDETFEDLADLNIAVSALPLSEDQKGYEAWLRKNGRVKKDGDFGLKVVA